jgi:hypothetical protein
MRVDDNHEVAKSTRRDTMPFKKCLMNIDIEMENNVKLVIYFYQEFFNKQNKLFDEINFLKKELVEAISSEVIHLYTGFDQ